jgi:hypothetical protein
LPLSPHGFSDPSENLLLKCGPSSPPFLLHYSKSHLELQSTLEDALRVSILPTIQTFHQLREP